MEGPELLAIGGAVLFTVQSLFHLAYRRDGGVPLSHRPLEQTSWRRAAGVLTWLAFIVGGIAWPWTADTYPAGHAVAGLLFVAGSIWFTYLTLVIGRVAEDDTTPTETWRRPWFAWWVMAVSVAAALASGALVVHAWPLARDSGEAGALVLAVGVAVATCAAATYAGWHLRLPPRVAEPSKT